jgi:hypothetical protein
MPLCDELTVKRVLWPVPKCVVHQYETFISPIMVAMTSNEQKKKE